MQLCVGQARRMSKYIRRSYHGLKYDFEVADIQRSFSLFPPVKTGGFFASGAAVGLVRCCRFAPAAPVPPAPPFTQATPICGLPRPILAAPPSLRGGPRVLLGASRAE